MIVPRSPVRRAVLAGLIALLLPMAAAAQSLYVRQTAEGYLNVRSGPGTIHDVMLRLSPGDRVSVEEEVGRWARVRLPSGDRGWVALEYLEQAPAATGPVLFVGRTDGGYLNLRAGPGTDSAVLRRMYPGDRLEQLGRSGDWLRVRHVSGALGWAHVRYVTR